MRHIGVDLHKTNFVVCYIEADDTKRLETYPLTRADLARFVAQLDAADELAVEATQNVHYFYDQVKAHVSRVAVVDTYRFGVIAKSKKKTDKADASALARFLKLGWLPEVSVPSEQVRTLRQLLQARETLVSMRTKLKNMAHAAFSRNGVALRRAAFASASRSLDGLDGWRFSVTPSRFPSPAERILSIARPWPRRRWCVAASAAPASVLPGAWRP